MTSADSSISRFSTFPAGERVVRPRGRRVVGSWWERTVDGWRTRRADNRAWNTRRAAERGARAAERKAAPSAAAPRDTFSMRHPGDEIRRL